MNFFKKVWEMVSPLLVYGLIQYVIATAVIFFFIYSEADPELVGDTAYLASLAKASYDMLDNNIVFISGISALAAIPILKRMLGREWLKRPYLIQESEPKAKKYLFVFMAAAGMTVAANLLINALEVFKYAADYAQTARDMYAEPLYIQVIVIGILMPVMEELIFRGLIYERVSNFSGEASGILLTSAIFGIYHGNLVQGVYAFCFSFLMIYAYKRTGSFLAPISFHIVSNLICLGLNRMPPLSTMGYSVGIVLSAMIGIYGFYELKQGRFFEVVAIEMEAGDEENDDFDRETEKDWD